MAIRYIDKEYGATPTTAIADDATGRAKVQNLPDAAGIAYDKVDGFLKYNDAGVIRSILASGKGDLANVTSLTAAGALLPAQSGSEFFLNLAAGFATTLPPPAAGLKFKFIVATAPTDGSYTIVTAASANIIFGVGYASTVDDAGFIASAEDTVTFVVDVALPGDWVELVSDGTNWYISGGAVLAESITTTAT